MTVSVTTVCADAFELLHELAHVWDQAGAIDPAAQSAFLAARGLASWGGDDVSWPHRGEEQAAEIMAWGLMERSAPIPTRVGEVGPQDPAGLAAAFTALTGRAPLFTAPQEGAVTLTPSGLRLVCAPDPAPCKPRLLFALCRGGNSGRIRGRSGPQSSRHTPMRTLTPLTGRADRPDDDPPGR